MGFAITPITPASPAGVIGDDEKLGLGTGSPAQIIWETADPNANALVFALPDGGATDVPVIVIGDQSVLNVDLGFFDGITEPSVAVVDGDLDSWVMFGFFADDIAAIRSNRGVRMMTNDDQDDYFLFEIESNVPTIYGIGAYLRIGDAATTSHSLNSYNDLMVSGELEVDGISYLDGDVRIASGSEITQGGATPVGSTNIFQTSGTSPFTIIGTNGGANMNVTLAHFGGSQLDGEIAFNILGKAHNDAGSPEEIQYGKFTLITVDVSDGAEDGKFQWSLANTGTLNNVAMELSGAGGLGVDADIGTADDPVALFDSYDDALMLKQGIQERNAELLADMGVFTRKDTGSGYMMNIQPMTRLLAGGIYQNRELIENNALEQAEEILMLKQEITMLNNRILALGG